MHSFHRPTRRRRFSFSTFSFFAHLLEFLAVLRVAVDEVLIGGQEALSGSDRSRLRLHEAAAEQAQIVGLLHRAAVDGRAVQETGHLVDLLPGAERAADSGSCAGADVLLALDVVGAVDRVGVGESDRIALRVELVQIHTATP